MVTGHQRRRAGGVDGERGSAQVIEVREAAREHGHHTGCRGGVAHALSVAVARAQDQVVKHEAAGEHAGATAGQAGRRDARILQGLPRGFEQQPLLRIENLGLARRDAEEGGVKELEVLVQETRPLNVAAPRALASGIVVALGVPTLGRNVDDRIAAVDQQLPEAFGVVHAAGQPAADTDDGQRLAPAGRRNRECRRRPADIAIFGGVHPERAPHRVGQRRRLEFATGQCRYHDARGNDAVPLRMAADEDCLDVPGGHRARRIAGAEELVAEVEPAFIPVHEPGVQFEPLERLERFAEVEIDMANRRRPPLAQHAAKEAAAHEEVDARQIHQRLVARVVHVTEGVDVAGQHTPVRDRGVAGVQVRQA